MIRDLFPVTEKYIYLNSGAVGPLSTITTTVLRQTIESELEDSRSFPGAWEGKRAAKVALRQRFAQMVKATEDEIALTHHTTDGMNIAAHGLAWQPGDEIITTNLEHPGGLIPFYVLQPRRGANVKVLSIEAEDSEADILAKFEAAITPKTRLLAFSHVAWNLGICLPLAGLAALAHQNNALVAVDAAQSTGAIDLDLPASGVDVYAMPGQKWLCGPEGVGALYVRRESLDKIGQTFVGYTSLDNGQYDYEGNFQAAPNATRYEVGTVNAAGVKAMAANMSWLAESVGWDWIYDRTRHLADYLRRGLHQLSGVSVITPSKPHAGLTSFNLDGYDPARVAARLFEEDIIIRTIKAPACLRASTGFYNTEAELDRLLAVLQTILAGQPEDLPVV